MPDSASVSGSSLSTLRACKPACIASASVGSFLWMLLIDTWRETS